jgi:predicted GNAT family acetyltransferase
MNESGEPQALPTERPELEVIDVSERSRYEATIEGEEALAALLEYRRSERWMALLHTEVQDGFEGRGIGSQMATAVFADARARDLKIIPKCPFILRWLERHSEQHDVLLRPLGDDGPAPSGSPLEPA